jgi:hypothetical protein
LERVCRSHPLRRALPGRGAALRRDVPLPLDHVADFGESRYGRWAVDPHADALEGRRVDLIGRSLDQPPGADPVAALTRYLNEGKTASARRLVEKAVVIIDPPALRGTIVWPRAALPASPPQHLVDIPMSSLGPTPEDILVSRISPGCERDTSASELPGRGQDRDKNGVPFDALKAKPPAMRGF